MCILIFAIVQIYVAIQPVYYKLAEMNISPEKAEMILEAMRNGEIQYIQQQKRKAIEKKDKGKPEW